VSSGYMAGMTGGVASEVGDGARRRPWIDRVPSEGTVDDLVDLDDLQEEYVRLAKEMVPLPVETTARQLESVQLESVIMAADRRRRLITREEGP